MPDIVPASRSNQMMRRSEEQLTQAIGFANQMLNRNYLIGLSAWPLAPIRDEVKRPGCIRLYKLSKLVFDTPGSVNGKLVTVYNALSSINSSVLLVADSDGVKVDYYLGIRSSSDASTAGHILEKALVGNFPGSSIEAMRNDRIEVLMTGVVSPDAGANAPKSVSAVSIVPSEREDDTAVLDTQSIETFFDTMAGSVYTAIIIAEPVGKDVMQERKLALERMHTALSPHVSSTLSYGESESQAVSEGVSQATAATLGESRSKAFGGGQTQSQSQSGQTRGLFGAMGSEGNSYSSSSSWTNSVASSTASTQTQGTTSATSNTLGTTKNLQVTQKNKTIEGMMERIERQLERIKRCEAFGLWECAAYFVAQDPQTTVIAANTYRSMMSGDESDVENAFVNLWTPRTQNNTKALLEYAKYCAHPAILVSDPATGQRQAVSPASLCSGAELPLILGLPKRSVTGLTTVQMAGFGRNVFTLTPPREAEKRRIELGRIRHMGVTGEAALRLSVESFTSHAFICGSTGSGKSNTVYLLLEELMRNGVKFLVVEPAKGEYRREFGGMKGVSVFTTNPGCFAMLKINPFQFPDGIHVLEHLERLIEIFGACWPMFGSMPAILKQSLQKIYQNRGWDLVNSVRLNSGGAVFPTFADLLKTMPEIIKSAGYSKETTSEYTGALVTRVKSLASGITGQIFCSGTSIPNRLLFDENAIIDLSRIGSSETKSLIMGVLILRLSEYRTATASGANKPLTHVTVLEEAHNILKRVSTTQSQDSANVAGKAVELLSASIAEMRTYGEGFIIVDQSPGAVDVSAIKNTNTKIIMRLPDKDDCAVVGKAASMRDDQIEELSRLPTGCAVVYQGNWLEPVMARVDKSSGRYACPDAVTDFAQLRAVRGRFLLEIYRQHDAKQYDIKPFGAICAGLKLNPFKQSEMRNMIVPLLKELEQSAKKTEALENATARIGACLEIFDRFPISVDKTALERPLPDKVAKKLRDWHAKLCEHLPGYLDLGGNDRAAARAVNFLLGYMGNAGLPDSPKYRIIMRALRDGGQ